jgi:hypothetical protein
MVSLRPNYRLMTSGGWEMLGEWLTTAKQNGSREFVRECLVALDRCPIDADFLRKDSASESSLREIVESLCRDSPDPGYPNFYERNMSQQSILTDRAFSFSY